MLSALLTCILLTQLFCCKPSGTDGNPDDEDDPGDDDTGDQPDEVRPVVGAATTLDLGSASPSAVSVVDAGQSWAVTFIDETNEHDFAVSWQGTDPVAVPLTAIEEARGTDLYPASYAASGIADGGVAWILVTDDNFDEFLGVAVARSSGLVDVAALESNASPEAWAASTGADALLIHQLTDGGRDLALRVGGSATELVAAADTLELATPGVPVVADADLVVVGGEVTEGECTGGELPVTLADLGGSGAMTSCLDLGEDSAAALAAAGGDGVAAALVLASRGDDQVQLLVTISLDGPSLAGQAVEVMERGPEDDPLPRPSAKAIARADQGWGLVTAGSDGDVAFTWIPDGGQPETFDLGFTSEESPSVAHSGDGFVVVGLSDDAVITVDIALVAAR